MAGVGILTAITAGISAGAQIYSGIEGQRSAEATETALRERTKQVESQTRAKQINDMERTNQTLGSQMVIGAANGYDLSSTSFNAVSADTLDKYEQDRNADLLSENYQKQAIDAQIQNAQSQGTAALWGGILKTAGTAANMYGNELFSSSSSGAASALGNSSAVTSDFQQASLPRIGLDYDSYLKYQQARQPNLFPNGGGI